MYSVHTKEGSNLTLTLDVPELDDFVPYMGWTESDVKLLQSDGYVGKMHAAFSRLKYKFNLHVKIVSAESIKLDSTKGGRAALIKAADNMVVDKNAVNAFLFSQHTGPFNFIPLTPWMVAHRMDHMIELTDLSGRNGNPDLRIKAAKLVVEFFKTISKTEYRLSLNSDSCLGCFNDSVNHLTSANLWGAVSTFRTARSVMEVPTSMDLTADVLAQYITTGRISFLRYEGLQSRIANFDLLPSTSLYSSRKAAVTLLTEIVQNTNQKVFDYEISKLEHSMNDKYAEILDQLVERNLLMAF